MEVRKKFSYAFFYLPFDFDFSLVHVSFVWYSGDLNIEVEGSNVLTCLPN